MSSSAQTSQMRRALVATSSWSAFRKLSVPFPPTRRTNPHRRNAEGGRRPHPRPRRADSQGGAGGEALLQAHFCRADRDAEASRTEYGHGRTIPQDWDPSDSANLRAAVRMAITLNRRPEAAQVRPDIVNVHRGANRPCTEERHLVRRRGTRLRSKLCAASRRRPRRRGQWEPELHWRRRLVTKAIRQERACFPDLPDSEFAFDRERVRARFLDPYSAIRARSTSLQSQLPIPVAA